MRAISTDIVLIGAVLSALGSDALQLLLGWSIRIANLHDIVVFSNRQSMKVLNDLLTDVAGLEAVTLVNRDSRQSTEGRLAP